MRNNAPLVTFVSPESFFSELEADLLLLAAGVVVPTELLGLA
jgi:hypothetical protein